MSRPLIMEVDPEKFEQRWKSHVNELERLRLSASGEDFERIGEIEDELNEIITSIAEEHKP